MKIMATRMHNRFDLSINILHGLLTRITETCLFKHRERVHVGSQEDSWIGVRTILENGDKSMSADRGVDIKIWGKLAEMRFDEVCSFRLLR